MSIAPKRYPTRSRNLQIEGLTDQHGQPVDVTSGAKHIEEIIRRAVCLFEGGHSRGFITVHVPSGIDSLEFYKALDDWVMAHYPSVATLPHFMDIPQMKGE